MLQAAVARIATCTDVVANSNLLLLLPLSSKVLVFTVEFSCCRRRHFVFDLVEFEGARIATVVGEHAVVVVQQVVVVV